MFDRAAELVAGGDKRKAITALRELLEHDPYNVDALNNLGACLAEIGDFDAASATLELAYSLDDSNMPAVVNHAKMLSDRRQSGEALPFLEQVKNFDPIVSYADAVYANLSLNRGEMNVSRHFQLRAWLNNFDNLRLANGYVFSSAYSELDEALLASEHCFWAETVRRPPIDDEDAAIPSSQADLVQQAVESGQRLRIGYWSSDFRTHSVRYFFRPLLEHHDRERVEVFLYHDYPKADAQTELIRDKAEHFHDVCDLTDSQLVKLLLSHRLDVLVELAGHTSENRLPLMGERLAPLQLTALGYPPTTGLTTIDAKVVDPYCIVEDSSGCYSERLMVLPESFWCFDPLEQTRLEAEPPVVKQGYITFACFGNVAKITQPTLDCWKRILERVPSSRMLIRALNFQDPAAEAHFQRIVERAGLPMERVALLKPQSAEDLFTSYNEVDIVLDTHPFNGGTTTCFATYMAVPVVTWAGRSLVSRMGASVVSNVGGERLVATDMNSYVECAVAVAGDIDFLRDYKQRTRARFMASSLGNGQRYARDFEAVCRNFLADGPAALADRPGGGAQPLPAREIMQRAYVVWGRGQTEAVGRIVKHCLTHYPNDASAHLLTAQLMASEDKLAEAIAYLEDRLPELVEDDPTPTLLAIVRYHLLLEQPREASAALDHITRAAIVDAFDGLQHDLFAAALMGCSTESVHTNAGHPAGQPSARRIHVIVSCSSEDRFLAFRMQVESVCPAASGWQVEFERCDESSKRLAYQAALTRADADIVVFAQRHLEIWQPGFWSELTESLQHHDLVGIAGARSWRRIDWRSEPFETRAAAMLADSSERPGFVEVRWAGMGREPLVGGMAVLDGCLIAANAKACRAIPFDADLDEAEFFLEEDWSHSAHRAGLKLAVNRCLGVFVYDDVKQVARSRAAGRNHLAEKYAFEAFAIRSYDNLMLSVPVPGASMAISTLRRFAMAKAD